MSRSKRPPKSRNGVVGKTHKIQKGLVVFKVRASPYYRARCTLSREGRREQHTTGCTNLIDARRIALEWYQSLLSSGALTAVPKYRTFAHLADSLLELERGLGMSGQRHPRLWKSTRSLLNNSEWGLLARFGSRDVTSLRDTDFASYSDWLKSRFALSPNTINHIADTWNKVMERAVVAALIAAVPAARRETRHDNPRPFFQFFPLVPRERDEYRLVLRTARNMAREQIRVGGFTVTAELVDLIIFVTNTFLRPTVDELYMLRHADVTDDAANDCLLLNVNGKNGFRRAVSMREARFAYRRLRAMHRVAQDKEYVFLPAIENREYAANVMQQQFRELLHRCQLRHPKAGGRYSLYSLRHTAISMRIILSEGLVSLLGLARTAGTSVDQIERFYTKHLPLSPEMIKNLQIHVDRPQVRPDAKIAGQAKQGRSNMRSRQPR